MYELLICWHAEEWRSRQSCLDHQYNDSVMHIYKPFTKNGQDDLSFFHDKAPNWTVAVAKFPGSRVLLRNLIVFFICAGTDKFSVFHFVHDFFLKRS